MFSIILEDSPLTIILHVTVKAGIFFGIGEFWLFFKYDHEVAKAFQIR